MHIVNFITILFVFRYRSQYNPLSGLPIIIQSDSDFKRYRFPGKGTFSNPYIIENLNIYSPSLNVVIPAAGLFGVLQSIFNFHTSIFKIFISFASPTVADQMFP